MCAIRQFRQSMHTSTSTYLCAGALEGDGGDVGHGRRWMGRRDGEEDERALFEVSRTETGARGLWRAAGGTV